jgi:hypothetical protein
MKEYLDWLGYKCRDRVTTFEGVADSVCFDLYGCVQVSVMPEIRAEDKERRSGLWFDVKRLEKVSDKRVMEPPSWLDTEPGKEIGPADKSAR